MLGVKTAGVRLFGEYGEIGKLIPKPAASWVKNVGIRWKARERIWICVHISQIRSDAFRNDQRQIAEWNGNSDLGWVCDPLNGEIQRINESVEVIQIIVRETIDNKKVSPNNESHQIRQISTHKHTIWRQKDWSELPKEIQKPRKGK